MRTCLAARKALLAPLVGEGEPAEEAGEALCRPRVDAPVGVAERARRARPPPPDAPERRVVLVLVVPSPVENSRAPGEPRVRARGEEGR